MQALFGAQYGDLEGAVQSAKGLVDLVVQFMAAAAGSEDKKGHGDILKSPVSSFTVYLPIPSIKESKKRAAGDAAATTTAAPARTLSMGLVKKKQSVDHQVGAGVPVLSVAVATPVNTISATLIKKKKPKLMADGAENGEKG